MLILFLVAAASAYAGYRVRQRDRVAAALLFAFSGFVAVGLVGAFFGWF